MWDIVSFTLVITHARVKAQLRVSPAGEPAPLRHAISCSSSFLPREFKHGFSSELQIGLKSRNRAIHQTKTVMSSKGRHYVLFISAELFSLSVYHPVSTSSFTTNLRCVPRPRVAHQSDFPGWNLGLFLQMKRYLSPRLSSTRSTVSPPPSVSSMTQTATISTSSP